MTLKPDLKVASTGSWLTDDRLFKTCKMCAFYEPTEYAWLCKQDGQQFSILDSQYHTTCRKFKVMDIEE